jgi:uncharacterized protein YjhX (UPF0386 family)
MKTNCAYCGKELERAPYRAKRRCYCNQTEVMLYQYAHGMMNSEVIANAHKALAEKNWNRGVPKPMLAGENNPAKQEAARAKISAFRLEHNWMRGRTGALHHLYLGGKIWWRGSDWDATKFRVRHRDGFMCVNCDMTEWQHLERFGQPLQVDHIVMYRISHDNSMQNLQTLCSPCHGKKIPEEQALVRQCRELLAA